MKKLSCLPLILAILFLGSCTHKEIKEMPPLKVFNHSFSNYDSVKLKHLYLELNVDFTKKVLSGKVVIDIDNSMGSKFVILDTKQLVIEKVQLEDSSNTPWSLGKEEKYVGQALVIEIGKNTQRVAVYYHTIPEAEALMWLDPAQTSGKRYPFLFTQSQAILARTWIPCMDAPAVRFTYSAKITCDSKYMALMSASNPQQINHDGVYSFEMDKPIPSYLMALAVGDIKFKSLGDNCGVYAEPVMLEKSANEFASLPSMIKSASELYGEYAWGRYDILVLPPSFPFGGMENPRLTFATPTIIAGDKSLVSLVAHELAHSWSGNLVTNNTWDDFWLNEGFTVYFEERIMEKIYGKDYADMLSTISLGELKMTLKDLMVNAPGDTKLKLNLKGRNPDDGVSDIAYIKGCMFLKLLESKVGRQKWDHFLNKYFNTYKWRTVNSEEFISYLNDNLLAQNPDVKIDLNQWIYEVGLPKDCPNVISQNFTKVEVFAKKVNLSKSLKGIDTAGFTTHHWLHFFRNLEPDSIKGLMQQLDTSYNLSKSTNSEIQCDWYLLCIENNYSNANPYIENYLLNVGRRKFLKPLYEALAKTPEGMKMGRAIFKKAESSYHAVSRNTIREILNLEAEVE
jgi:leukotriene-A4 hydrolase